MPSPCAFLARPQTPPESLVVALTSAAPSASSNAPPLAPGSVIARFIDAQMYETLVGLDCDGKLLPRLAASWTSDATARTTLRLRDDARFWNGDPITARDVVDAWQRTANAGPDPTSASIARAMLEGVSIVSDRSLTIPDAALRTLADPALAVNRPPLAPGAPWPEGSGPYRIAATPTPRRIALVPTRSDAPAPRIVVDATTDADARDRLDAGADLLITSDPVVASYASARQELELVPLPWSSTYVLLLPRHVPPASSSSGAAAADTLRAALARDAVRADARAAVPPFWWQDKRDCANTVSIVPDANADSRAALSSRIIYPRDDGVARQLAQRLVALAAMRSGPRASSPVADLSSQLAATTTLVAEGLDAAPFSAALSAGRALAYVIPLPAPLAAPCEHLAGLLTFAPWLSADLIVPLVQTRSTAIVRRGRVSFVIGWDGVIRIGPPPAPPSANR